MSKVKTCGCGKVISDNLAYCWSCWKPIDNRVKRYYCTCGIDVTPEEANKECLHADEEKYTGRMTKTQYRHFEYWCATTAELDGSWLELELEQAKQHLLKQIDIALENGAENEFLELTAKLTELMELA